MKWLNSFLKSTQAFSYYLVHTLHRIQLTFKLTFIFAIPIKSLIHNMRIQNNSVFTIYDTHIYNRQLLGLIFLD